MIKKNIFLVGLLIINLCCTNKKQDKNNYLKIDKSQNNKQVSNAYIIGTSDSPKALEYFSVLPISKINERKLDDTLFIKLDSIVKPQFFDLYSFTEKEQYFTTVMVSPGDTLFFKIKNKQLEFYGENAVANNFYQLLNKSTTDYKDTIYYSGNLLIHKTKVKSIYDKKIKFLNEYIKKHPNLTKNFIYKFKADLKYKYLLELLEPRNKEYISQNVHYYYNDGQNALDLLAYRNNNETLINLSKYFDDIGIEDLKKPELLDNQFFINCLNGFVKNYFTKTNHIDYSREKFLAQKKFILENFKDSIETYAVANMIIDYYKKGFGLSKNNIGLLRNLIKEYENRLFNTTYKKKMAEIKNSLDILNFKLSEYALDTKLLNRKGDTTTLKEIFAITKSKIKVMNLWASWCPPCIKEITEAKRFRNELSTQNNVEFIYLSIDKDKNKWLKKSNQLKEYFNTKQQYLIMGGKNSALGKTLKISGVPRYVIFDKKEQITRDNAPRPSDSLVFKKIIDKINLGKLE